jgi:hypothetical protein
MDSAVARLSDGSTRFTSVVMIGKKAPRSELSAQPASVTATGEVHSAKLM